MGGLRKVLGLKRQRSDARDWLDRTTYQPGYWRWARRAHLAAGMCREDGWVSDLGCGMQVLRHFLPRGVVYLPADLRQWTDDTEFCDLNAGKLPLRSLTQCDVAVMLGVIEYIVQPEKVLAELSQRTEFIVLSYNATDTHPRRVPHWTLHLSRSERRGMVARQGFRIEREILFDRQMLLRARNERFSPEMRAYREAARSEHLSRVRNALHDEWERIRHNVLIWVAR